MDMIYGFRDDSSAWRSRRMTVSVIVCACYLCLECSMWWGGGWKREAGGGVGRWVADICTTYRAFSALPFVLAVCFIDKELGEGENEI